MRNFNKVLPNLTDAVVEDGLLWVAKPKFPWSFLYNTPRYHIIDYNLFYVNVRKNAQARAEAFLADN